MRALFDVNILLALLDQDHIFHERARTWWARERERGWSSCPLTQNGFVRIISQQRYNSPRTVAEALGMLLRATTTTDHEFWSDDFSILDEAHVDHTRLLGSRQLTDIYLLALAVKRGGRLVTLDRSISWQASRAASEANLEVVC